MLKECYYSAASRASSIINLMAAKHSLLLSLFFSLLFSFFSLSSTCLSGFDRLVPRLISIDGDRDGEGDMVADEKEDDWVM